MYRAIIADDNILIRESLVKTIPWSELNIKIIGVAQNGIEEKKLILNAHPDIIITDIKMPGLSGLEVIQIIRKLKSNAKVIVISGYNEFEYAQKAIKLGVFDFLLKPVSNDEMVSILNKVVHDIETERRKNDKIDAAKQQQLNRVLADITMEKQTYDDLVIKEIIRENHLKKCKYIYTIFRLKTNYRERGPQVLNYLENSMKQKNNTIIVNVYDNIIETIFYFEKNISNAIIDIRLKKILNEYASGVNDVFDEKIGIAVSNCTIDFFKLSDLRKQCIEIMEKVFWCSSEVIMFYKYYKVLNIDSSEMIMREIQQLNDYPLEIENIRKIKEVIIQYLNSIEKTGQGNEFYIKCLLSEACLEINRKCSSIVSVIKNCDANIVLDEINQLTDINNAKTFFESYIENLIKQMQNTVVSDKPIIENTLNYIKLNYRNPNVSLSEAADVVDVNASYLSRLLKKETGKNFSEILTEVRLEKAKRLLKRASMKISDIAGDCGYKEYAYFYQVFKQYTGISPTEYKKMNIKNE